MKETIENLERLFVFWTLGILGGIIFFIFRLTKRIEIEGYKIKKFIPSKEGLIIIYNHPSLWEPGVLPFLLFPFFLFSLKFTPYSTPDKKNFFDKWWFWPIRLMCIPIDRQKARSEALRKMIRKVNQGKIVIVAPEGGRTDNGEEFKILKDGQIIIKEKNELLPEEKNLPKIRRFQRGFSAFLNLTKANLVPIWTEGGDKVISIPPKGAVPKGPYFLVPNLKEKTIIKIGKRIKIKDVSQLEDELLKLSQNGKSAH